MKNRIYIVEGDIEKNFIHKMIVKGFIKPGKQKTFNLVQKLIKPSNVLLQSRYDEIICIIDTDILEQKHRKYLFDNLNELRKLGVVSLLVQCRNFEEEMIYVVAPVKWYAYFGISTHSLKDWKKYLVDEKYSKFDKNQYQKYCERSKQTTTNFRLSVPKSVQIKTGRDL